MPRIDMQEFERRAQRVRKAEMARKDAEAVRRASIEALKIAEDELAAAREDFTAYVHDSAGVDRGSAFP